MTAKDVDQGSLETNSSFRRASLKVVAVWIVLMMAAIGMAPTGAVAQSASHEQAFINEINQVRAQQGLPALVADSQLTNLARSWAQAQRDGVCPDGAYICHASPLDSGVTHSWAKLGENVGTGPAVAPVMDAFIASPGHYANIIDPAFTHIGVGVVWDGARLYTTHRFMDLNGYVTATTAPPATSPPATSPPATSPPATSPPATSPPATSPPATTAAPTTTATPAPTTEAPVPTTAPVAIPFVPEPELDPVDSHVDSDRVTVLISALVEVSR